MIVILFRLCDYRTTVRLLDNKPLPSSSPAHGVAAPGIKPVQKADLIEGFITGLAVINAFTDANPLLTASDLAARLVISRAAARRYLITLTHAGYAASDGKAYWLTPRVLALGYSYLGSARLPRTVRPFLQQITTEVLESSNLALLDGHDVVYVARANATRLMSTALEPGTRLPAHTTAAGHVILGCMADAALDQWLAHASLSAHTPHTLTSRKALTAAIRLARAQGYAAIESQFEIGLRGIAVPLTNRQGEALGALGVSMAISSCALPEAIRRCVPVLKRAADALKALV